MTNEGLTVEQAKAWLRDRLSGYKDVKIEHMLGWVSGFGYHPLGHTAYISFHLSQFETPTISIACTRDMAPIDPAECDALIAAEAAK